MSFWFYDSMEVLISNNLLMQLEMEDWDEIDAKVYKMGGLWGIAASLLKLQLI